MNVVTARAYTVGLLALSMGLACEPDEAPRAPVTAEVAEGTAAPATEGTAWTPAQGAHLIGQPAPAWEAGKEWMGSEPLTLADLRGKVVLIRFWLVGCGYCKRTAPALRQLHADYKDRGLVVLGFHHPKSARSRDHEVVRQTAKDYGFDFPIAFDDDWEALRKYWLDPVPDYKFTSVSFLIDKEGVIRWVHDGGEFHEMPGERYRDARAAHASLRATIERLL